MRLLLDSHSAVGREPTRVALEQRAVLADKTNEVFVSSATAWELTRKRAKGKLAFSGGVQERLSQYGFVELPISIRHAERAASLEWVHRDPFDRMLVAPG